jgi:hypothetical protein
MMTMILGAFGGFAKAILRSIYFRQKMTQLNPKIFLFAKIGRISLRDRNPA